MFCVSVMKCYSVSVIVIQCNFQSNSLNSAIVTSSLIAYYKITKGIIYYNTR
jgi:hypothetical protein